MIFFFDPTVLVVLILFFVIGGAWSYNGQSNKRWNAATKKYFTQRAFIATSGIDFGEVRTASECMKRFDKLIKPYMK